MKNINWVNSKNINSQKVTDKLNDCLITRQFTNGGKNVKSLEAKLKNLLGLENDKEVIMTCNGAMAINALVGCFCRINNKKLIFAVQSFTFPCSKQGLLMDSIVMDVDENMGPNIKELTERKNEYDGVLVTNCFGCSVNIDLYDKFCNDNNKILLFDNAASPYSLYNGKNILNYGHGCIISLHHTKPIGFGEGGAVIVNKTYREEIEKMICFGYSNVNRFDYDIYAANYKMSEIAAVYIDQWLDHFHDIQDKHKKLISYFLNKISDKNIKIFKTFGNYNEQIMPTIPILFDKKISIDKFIKNNIEAKKYYYPLDKNCANVCDLFDRIICLPLNIDMNYDDIDRYLVCLSN